MTTARSLERLAGGLMLVVAGFAAVPESAANPGPGPGPALTSVAAAAVPAPADASLVQAAASSTGQELELGRFGTFRAYSPAGPPTAVALLLSQNPEGPAAAELRDAMTGLGALVVGVDTARYEKATAGRAGCAYPAADFEALSHFVERKLQLTDYLPPVLVGEGAASALAYATLAQAPPGTFEGAVTRGLCRLPSTPYLLCRGDALDWEARPGGAGYGLKPSNMTSPWVVLLGRADPQCPAEALAGFVAQTPAGRMLPPPGEGDSLSTRVAAAFQVVFERHQLEVAAEAIRSADVRDLPLVEMRPPATKRRTLFVVVSGDGGWAGTDRRLAELLSTEEGFPLVGLDSLRYFWRARTPDGVAADLARVLEHYLRAWELDQAVVVGYSQGADVVPFMVARLPKAMRERVRLVVAVGSDGAAAFETDHSSYMTGQPPLPEIPVAPEVARLRGIRLLCVHGAREKRSLCDEIAGRWVRKLRLQAGHAFKGDMAVIVGAVVRSADLRSAGE